MVQKKKVVKKKVVKKKTTQIKPPEIKDENKNDDAIIDSINSNDNSSVDSHRRSDVPQDKKILVNDSDLIPPVSEDSSAINRVKLNKAKGRPMKKSPSKAKSNSPSMPPDDSVTQLLKPDSIKTIIKIANNRLKEAGSIWAMEDGERDDMSDAIIGVVDKYFPDAGAWSVEATLIIVSAMYAIPRVMHIREAAKVDTTGITDTVKEANPELQKAPAPVASNAGVDPRLAKYK